jgi:hypothetical protein
VLLARAMMEGVPQRVQLANMAVKRADFLVEMNEAGLFVWENILN